MAPAPSVRVVVRLPWNRPETDPILDPPRIEWNTEKADMLWKVIERSRSVDSGGADWKGLAAHLEVPLPYLLYRVHARFQEELRGLKDIQGALNPSGAQPPTPSEDKLSPVGRAVGRMTASASSRRLATPLGVRARLNSLGANSLRPKKATSSSTLTVQGLKKTIVPMRPTSPSSSEKTDTDDEDAMREEVADRDAEEREALDRKLQHLQKMMTDDALGLVSALQTRDKGKSIDRGRNGIIPQRSDTLSSRSTSQSVSSTSSPQGSIPDIPSPPGDSQPHSPIRRHMSSKSSSPPAVSPRSALGRRYGPLVDRTVSEQGSNYGSEASSFSDISDASLSASALDSVLSNIRNNGSRPSFARSRLLGRGV